MNLLPEELVTTFDPKKKLTTVGLAMLATALLVGIVYVGLLLYRETQVRRANELEANVVETNHQISTLRDRQVAALAFRDQNNAIALLLVTHPYWTRFLAAFESVTFPDIFYENGISADLGGQLSLTGTAPSINRVIEQLYQYQQATDVIRSVKINTITRQEKSDKYNFVVDFEFQPTVFYQPLLGLTESFPTLNTNPVSNVNATPTAPSVTNTNTP